MRESRSTINEFAKANRTKLITEEKMEIKITGLLPSLSETRPRIGENRNCINENEPIKIPRAKAPASASSGWKGKTGITMPNPIMSMKVVMTITKIGEMPNLREVGGLELTMLLIVKQPVNRNRLAWL
jgi:hypothetical protein